MLRLAPPEIEKLDIEHREAFSISSLCLESSSKGSGRRCAEAIEEQCSRRPKPRKRLEIGELPNTLL